MLTAPYFNSTEKLMAKLKMVQLSVEPYSVSVTFHMDTFALPAHSLKKKNIVWPIYPRSEFSVHGFNSWQLHFLLLHCLNTFNQAIRLLE